MSDEEPNAQTVVPEWQRPLPDQVASNRHAVANLDGRLTLLHGMYERLAERVGHGEDRLTMVEAQVVGLSITPDALAEVVEGVLERRSEKVRAERLQDFKAFFSTSKTVALYVIALGQALLMLGVIWALIGGHL